MQYTKFISLVTLSVALANAAHADAPDAGFGMPGFNGWQTDYFVNSTLINEEATAMVRLGDGGYLVAGRVQNPNALVPNGRNIGLAKYLPDGSLDVSFGGSAKMGGKPGHAVFDAAFTSVNDVAVDYLGRILVVGTTPTGPNGDDDFGVVRFTADGKDLDTTFAGSGATHIDLAAGGGNNDTPMQVVPTGFGGVLIVGSASAVQSSCAAVVSLDGNGNRIAAFGNHGQGRDLFCRTQHYLSGIGIVPTPYSDGYAFVLGMTDLDAGLSTSIDALLFDTNGAPLDLLVLPKANPSQSVEARAIAAQDDHHIILAGLRKGPPNAALACRVTVDRATASLSFDTSFGPNCYVSAQNDMALSVAIRPDRSVVLAGEAAAGFGGTLGMTTLLTHGKFIAENSSNFRAPWNGAYQAFGTSFARVIVDGDRPVFAGYRTASSNADADRDFSVLRVTTDALFGNGYED